jgi:hypothetical protein
VPKRRTAVALTLPGMDVGPKAGPVSAAARALCVPHSKSRSRPVPAPKPWEAVVISVDAAGKSGWAIGLRGKVVESGEHDTARHPELTLGVVQRGVSLAKLHELPVVMVLEFMWGGRFTATVGCSIACDRWRTAWRAAGQSRGRMGRVQPKQWRGPVLGTHWAHAKRDEVRPVEQAMARGIVGRDDVGEDEAPAICMQHWAARSALVGKLIGKRASDASLRLWTGMPAKSRPRREKRA